MPHQENILVMKTTKFKWISNIEANVWLVLIRKTYILSSSGAISGNWQQSLGRITGLPRGDCKLSLLQLKAKEEVPESTDVTILFVRDCNIGLKHLFEQEVRMKNIPHRSRFGFAVYRRIFLSCLSRKWIVVYSFRM